LEIRSHVKAGGLTSPLADQAWTMKCPSDDDDDDEGGGGEIS
jgi:hypothetical protein